MKRHLLLSLAVATSAVALPQVPSYAGKARVARVAASRTKGGLLHRIVNGKVTLLSWGGRPIVSVGIRPTGTANGEVVLGVAPRHAADVGATIGLVKAEGTGGLNVAPWVTAKGDNQISLGIVSRTKGDRVLNVAPIAMGDGARNLQVGLFTRIKNRIAGRRSVGLGLASTSSGKGAISAGAVTRASEHALGIGAAVDATHSGTAVGLVGSAASRGRSVAAFTAPRRNGTGESLVAVPVGGRTHSAVDLPFFQGRKTAGTRATSAADSPTVLAVMPKASRSLVEVNLFKQTRVPLRSSAKRSVSAPAELEAAAKAR
jgi:hypothetical protein